MTTHSEAGITKGTVGTLVRLGGLSLLSFSGGHVALWLVLNFLLYLLECCTENAAQLFLLKLAA